jgi:hypothetical protein
MALWHMYLLKARTVEPEKQLLFANGSETIFFSKQRSRNKQTRQTSVPRQKNLDKRKLNNNPTATEEQCFLWGPCRDVITGTVWGDEKESLKSERVKYGREFPRDSDPRKTVLARASYMCKIQTRPLVRECAPKKQEHNCQTTINTWTWAPNGARHQDLMTDWPTVAMWL